MTLNSPPALEKIVFFLLDMHKLDMYVTLTQMTAKKGIKKHEERERWQPFIRNIHNLK